MDLLLAGTLTSGGTELYDDKDINEIALDDDNDNNNMDNNDDDENNLINKTTPEPIPLRNFTQQQQRMYPLPINQFHHHHPYRIQQQINPHHHHHHLHQQLTAHPSLYHVTGDHNNNNYYYNNLIGCPYALQCPLQQQQQQQHYHHNHPTPMPQQQQQILPQKSSLKKSSQFDNSILTQQQQHHNHPSQQYYYGQYGLPHHPSQQPYQHHNHQVIPSVMCMLQQRQQQQQQQQQKLPIKQSNTAKQQQQQQPKTSNNSNTPQMKNRSLGSLLLMNRQCDKHVEVLNFVLKGGPPWGFRIKQRNGNVFISKVNCGGRGHKGGLRVHDEIMAVNNFELDNHPLTLHRHPTTSRTTSMSNLSNIQEQQQQPTATDAQTITAGSVASSVTRTPTNNPIADNNNNNNNNNNGANNNNNNNQQTAVEQQQSAVADDAQSTTNLLLNDFDELELTKLDFTYQLIKHTLNRQLQLTVRRWHSDWELAPSIFLPISSSSLNQSLRKNAGSCASGGGGGGGGGVSFTKAPPTTPTMSMVAEDSEGPLHQSEEELLSPNEDFGPESRNVHRKILSQMSNVNISNNYNQNYNYPLSYNNSFGQLPSSHQYRHPIPPHHTHQAFFYDPNAIQQQQPYLYQHPQQQFHPQMYQQMQQHPEHDSSTTRAIRGDDNTSSYSTTPTTLNDTTTASQSTSTSTGCLLSQKSLKELQKEAEMKIECPYNDSTVTTTSSTTLSTTTSTPITNDQITPATTATNTSSSTSCPTCLYNGSDASYSCQHYCHLDGGGQGSTIIQQGPFIASRFDDQNFDDNYEHMNNQDLQLDNNHRRIIASSNQHQKYQQRKLKIRSRSIDGSYRYHHHHHHQNNRSKDFEEQSDDIGQLDLSPDGNNYHHHRHKQLSLTSSSTSSLLSSSSNLSTSTTASSPIKQNQTKKKRNTRSISTRSLILFDTTTNNYFDEENQIDDRNDNGSTDDDDDDDMETVRIKNHMSDTPEMSEVIAGDKSIMLRSSQQSQLSTTSSISASSTTTTSMNKNPWSSPSTTATTTATTTTQISTPTSTLTTTASSATSTAAATSTATATTTKITSSTNDGQDIDNDNNHRNNNENDLKSSLKQTTNIDINNSHNKTLLLLQGSTSNGQLQQHQHQQLQPQQLQQHYSKQVDNKISIVKGKTSLPIAAITTSATLSFEYHQQQQNNSNQIINDSLNRTKQTKTFPPPFSSKTYAEFKSKQQQQYSSPPPPPSSSSISSSTIVDQQQQTITPPIDYIGIDKNSSDSVERQQQLSSTTLPRNMAMMDQQLQHQPQPQQQQYHHVADVYEPRQHPVHKYWTLPRSIATGTNLGVEYITSDDNVQEIDRHHVEQQQTKIIYNHETLNEYYNETTGEDSVLSPPSPSLPKPLITNGDSEKIVQQQQQQTTYAVPMKKSSNKMNMNQPQESNQSTTTSTSTVAATSTITKTISSERYKQFMRDMRDEQIKQQQQSSIMNDNRGAGGDNNNMKNGKIFNDNNNTICVKLKHPRFTGTDYHLTIDNKPIQTAIANIPVGSIEDYEPGKVNSIFEREKQMQSPRLMNGHSMENGHQLVDDHHHQPQQLQPKQSPKVEKKFYYHENCVFNQLTSPPSSSSSASMMSGQKHGVPGGVGASGSGYDSDSSYILRKNKGKIAPQPASPSIYRAVQRGEDIPFQGLQRTMPQLANRTMKPRNELLMRKTTPPTPDLRLSSNYRHDDVDHRNDGNNSSMTSNLGYVRHYVGPCGGPLPGTSLKPVIAIDNNNTSPSTSSMTQTNNNNNYNLQRHHYLPQPMSPPIVALDRYDRRSLNSPSASNTLTKGKIIAKVLYDFQAMAKNELAVKKDDLVEIRKLINENWFEVEDCSSGLVGFVPRSYLDFNDKEMIITTPISSTVITTPSIGQARAKFDFNAKTNVEISFKKNEKLILIRKVDDNWFEGMNARHDVGIFPISYVEILNNKNVLLTNIDRQSSSSSTSATIQKSIKNNQINNEKIDQSIQSKLTNITLSLLSSSSASASPPPPPSTTHSSSSSSSLSSMLLMNITSNDDDCLKHFLRQQQHHSTKQQPIIDEHDHHHHHHHHRLLSSIIQPSSMSSMPQLPIENINNNRNFLVQHSNHHHHHQHQHLVGSNLNNYNQLQLSSIGGDYSSTSTMKTTTTINSYGGGSGGGGVGSNNQIYFSSTRSEPSGSTTSGGTTSSTGTGYLPTAQLSSTNILHQIRRAPDASRSQPGANVERFCLPKPKIYRVLYPYQPQQPDELELQYGDLLTVTIQCDDGWFLGRSTLTGKFGTFPGNYVEST